jgi:hypothetical protein
MKRFFRIVLAPIWIPLLAGAVSIAWFVEDGATWVGTWKDFIGNLRS